MLDAVKKSLRMSSDALNDDISASITAALLDMGRVGVDTLRVDIADPDTYDALIVTCVEYYCKWIYDFLQKGEQWKEAYESLRDAMSMCKDYKL